MKNTLILFTILVLSACSNQKKDSRIVQFENYLGSEKSDLLTKKVTSFENFLVENFKKSTLEENYREFLRIIAFDEIEKIDWEVERANREEIDEVFELTHLRQEIWNKPDSVWIDDTVLICRTYYINNSDTLELGYKNYHSKYRNKKLNLDSIINAEKKILSFNHNGKYYKGLELIKDSDSTLLFYLDFRSDYGGIPIGIFAERLLSSKTDYSDYFVKRIIMVELYKEIRLPTAANRQ